MQRQTGQGMDMKPNTSNNEPTVFCGICKRHETKNENVLCGRDGEQCAKCAGIEQGYAKALDDIEKIIDKEKGTRKDWSANGVLQNCFHLCSNCRLLTTALHNQDNIVKCYKCGGSTKFIAYDNMDIKFDVKRQHIWNFADRLKLQIAKLAKESKS